MLGVTTNPSNIYSPLRQASLRSASPTVSINFYVNATLTPLSSLATPFILTIPFHSSTPSVHRLIQAVFSASPSTSKEQVISKGEVSCQFFDEDSHSLSSAGCLVLNFTNTTLTCSCTHLTDFVGFVSASISTLEESNYSVILALTEVTLSSL